MVFHVNGFMFHLYFRIKAKKSAVFYRNIVKILKYIYFFQNIEYCGKQLENECIVGVRFLIIIKKDTAETR